MVYWWGLLGLLGLLRFLGKSSLSWPFDGRMPLRWRFRLLLVWVLRLLIPHLLWRVLVRRVLRMPCLRWRRPRPMGRMRPQLSVGRFFLRQR